MAGGHTVGYLRVSTVDQNESRQLADLSLDRTFTDKASGKDVERPQLKAMMAHVRDGDTVVIHSMDRLARNVDDLRKIVSELTGKGVRVKFVKEGLEFTGEKSPIANMMLSVMGAVAEFERDLIRERQREGIAIAKAKGGVYRGRVKSLTSDKTAELLRRMKAGEPKAGLARDFGISRASVYNYAANGAELKGQAEHLDQS
jgi:DNA invertase Pin-like site-specific DNA recombinase